MSGILGRELVWANAEAGMHKCVLETARGPLFSSQINTPFWGTVDTLSFLSCLGDP